MGIGPRHAWCRLPGVQGHGPGATDSSFGDIPGRTRPCTWIREAPTTRPFAPTADVVVQSFTQHGDARAVLSDGSDRTAQCNARADRPYHRHGWIGGWGLDVDRVRLQPERYGL